MNDPRWVAPPTWPQPEPGWQPPAGWQPLPEWGPAPEGWQFWQQTKPWNKMSPAEKKAADPAKAKKDQRTGFIVLALSLLVVGGCIASTGGDDEEKVTTSAASAESEPEVEIDPAKAAADKAAADSAAAEKAAAEKAAADKAAADKAAADKKAAEKAAAEEAAKGTPSQQQAYNAGIDYLEFSAFSRAGLIGQLSSKYGSQFPAADAEFAVARIEREGKVDWNEQAARAAKEYLEFSSFSRQGLLDQLTSKHGSQFTQAQAEYGVNQTGL